VGDRERARHRQGETQSEQVHEDVHEREGACMRMQVYVIMRMDVRVRLGVPKEPETRSNGRVSTDANSASSASVRSAAKLYRNMQTLKYADIVTGAQAVAMFTRACVRALGWVGAWVDGCVRACVRACVRDVHGCGPGFGH